MPENSWTLYNFPGTAVMAGQRACIDSATAWVGVNSHA